MRLRAFGASLAGATFGCFIAAALDARFAVQRQPAPWSAAFAVSFGMLVPLAIAFACIGWATRVLLLDSAFVPRLGLEEKSVRAANTHEEKRLGWLREVAIRLSPSDAAARRELAVVTALAPWFIFFSLLALSRAALSALASPETGGTSGVRLGLVTTAILGIGWLWLEALSRYCRAQTWRAPSPLLCLAVSAGAMSIVFGTAVVTGAPSGAGGAWQMLGVLNRDELDLRPVGLIALIAGASVVWPEPAPERRATAFFALSLAAWLGSLAFTLHAARAGFEQRSVALAIETVAPLAGKLLPSFRKRFDRDRDGYSAYFGGGDCDDGASGVNPLAEDVPGNGRDEDCSGSDASALAAPATSTPAAPSGALRLPDPLNVVLLTVDTLRYDLGYAGNPRKISPKLDQLAAESVVFERAYSLASYTAKSLPPMLIGKYSGETHRGWSHFNRFEKTDSFLAERLQRAGVRTVSVQGHWYFFQNFGMERGFDVIDSSAAPRALQAAEGDRSSTSEAVSNAVIGQLDKLTPPGKPFFLWAHYTDPHAEYLQHEGFEFGTASRGLYESEVAFVDHHVGRVLDALRTKPFWDRTVVIITSDHGEAFGEHGMIRHGFELWEELVRVPLIVRVPSVQGRKIAARRSAIDLVPTILELFRIEPPPAPTPGSPDFVSGRSLLADVASEPVPRAVFIDMAEGPHNAERRAFIDGDLKLVTSRGRPLGLYDLAKDPAEKQDLASDRSLLQPIQERYAAFRRSLREVTVRPSN